MENSPTSAKYLEIGVIDLGTNEVDRLGYKDLEGRV